MSEKTIIPLTITRIYKKNQTPFRRKVKSNLKRPIHFKINIRDTQVKKRKKKKIRPQKRRSLIR